MKEKLVEYNCNQNNIFNKYLKSIKVSNRTIPEFIREILKTKYKWVDSVEMGGVYDTGLKNDNIGRSLLNYMDSNNIGLCVLINWINKKIIMGDETFSKYTQIDFYLSDWKHEIFNFFKILSENKNYIFNSPIINELLIIFRNTSNKGDYAEKETIKRLIKVGIPKSNIKQSKFGETKDMLKGIDIEFIYKNKTYTIQTKSYKKMESDLNYFTFYYVSNLKKYDTNKIDFISLYDNKYGFYLFTYNDEIKHLNNNTLKIPVSLYKRKI
jgi:hypothetical protein